MGGKVAKKLGDGLMALFGYPLAQENDAERAVRAALAIQRALAELNRKNADTGKPALAARIAIESWSVVVDAVGEIFGDVPNIAARAQALAEPGAVVVTGRVQRPSGSGGASSSATATGSRSPTSISRMSRDGARRRTCSSATRPGASPPTSPSCPSCWRAAAGKRAAPQGNRKSASCGGSSPCS
jgi:class 3 adenylate cyclase